MKRVVLWGWHSKCAVAAIGALKEKQRLEVVAWFGQAQQCSHDLDQVLHQFDLGRRRYSGAGAKIHQEVYRSLPEFMQMYSRVSYSMGRSFHETRHIFNIYVDYFAEMLLRNRVDLVLFSNLPHFGVDFLLYEVARSLNIKTVMGSQSLVPNRFFYVHDLEDFGRFDAAESGAEDLDLVVERTHAKDLSFYMSRLPRVTKGCWPSLLNDLLHLVAFKKKKPMTLTGAVHKFQVCRAFNRGSRSLLASSVDLGRPFVYFPLQLQPELTTSALGGMYEDQLLALERIRALIPDDWYIYAKENPKQTKRQRDEFFFRRLAAIDNVVYVGASVNTYALIENCRFVATITGTAGWEAVSGGKCALVFGRAWYQTLPGVFTYSATLTLDQIMSCTIDHDHLVRQYNALISKTAPGVLDPGYVPLVADYCQEKNIRLLENFVDRFL